MKRYGFWLKISLKFIHMGPIDNIPACVQIMAWRRPGDKPLSRPVLINLLTHICVTRPQCVKLLCTLKYTWCFFAFKNVTTSHLTNINHIYAHMKFRVFASGKNHFLLTTKMNVCQDIKVNGIQLSQSHLTLNNATVISDIGFLNVAAKYQRNPLMIMYHWFRSCLQSTGN